MHQQLRGGDPTRKPRLQTERRRQEARNVFDLVNEGRARYRVCVILSLSLFNLVIGWTQTAAEMKKEKDQRPRKTCSHVFQTHSQGIKEVNEARKKKKRPAFVKDVNL